KIIWITEEIGSGKSSVAHSLAEHLREEGKLAASFFFARNHPKRNNFDNLFLTLAYQLGLHHPRARDIITQAIVDDPALLFPEKSRRDQFEKLIIVPLKDLARVWKMNDKAAMTIILDAVDE
ncbi:hypothetical protein CONPUDRAFT_43638, partial [Coniophora puteana RWD-64-598 SS2]